MKRYFANNIKIDEYFTWHNSGFWGSHKVVYIGRGFVMDKHGRKCSFEDIIKGHYTDWETLPDRFGRNDAGLYITHSEDIYKSHPEYKEYQALRESLGLVVPRQKRIEIVEKRKKVRKVSKIFENIRVFSGNDFNRNVKNPQEDNSLISLENLDNQYFITRETKGKKEAYSLGYTVENYIRKHGINEPTLKIALRYLISPYDSNLLCRLFKQN